MALLLCRICLHLFIDKPTAVNTHHKVLFSCCDTCVYACWVSVSTLHLTEWLLQWTLTFCSKINVITFKLEFYFVSGNVPTGPMKGFFGQTLPLPPPPLWKFQLVLNVHFNSLVFFAPLPSHTEFPDFLWCLYGHFLKPLLKTCDLCNYICN